MALQHLLVQPLSLPIASELSEVKAVLIRIVTVSPVQKLLQVCA